MVDTGGVSGEQAEIDRIVDEFVGTTAHVRGAVLGSADGHPLAARLDDIDAEASTVAAMTSFRRKDFRADMGRECTPPGRQSGRRPAFVPTGARGLFQSKRQSA